MLEMSFDNTSDTSPPRSKRNKVDNDDYRLRDRDASPPRRRPSDSNIDQDYNRRRNRDASPPRRRPSDSKINQDDNRRRNRDASPPRRRPPDSNIDQDDNRRRDRDASPPRRRPSDYDERNDGRHKTEETSPPRTKSADNFDVTRKYITKEKKNKSSEYSISNSSAKWGVDEKDNGNHVNISTSDDVVEDKEEYKPNFGLSGALAKDEKTGNMRNGVVLQYSEALDSVMPDKKYRLYVFKGEEQIEILHLHRKSSYLFGRDERVADIHTAHPSCSKQHAVLQYRLIRKKEVTGEYIEKIKPYIIDLNSANKTILNGEIIEEARYYELISGDSLKFGNSTREYIFLLS